MSDRSILLAEIGYIEERKSELLNYINTQEFESSRYDNQSDVFRQYEAMCNYSDCLERRLSRAPTE